MVYRQADNRKLLSYGPYTKHNRPQVSMSHTKERTRQRFAETVAHEDGEIELAEAALLIAAEEYPNLIITDYLRKLDRFAEEARQGIAPARAPIEMINGLNRTIFHELGFQGNTEHYYDPRNSFLSQVIDRRKGIPITLSVVYVEVARRIGLDLLPVGLPGHFLVKHAGPGGELFIDPFNGGRVMNESEVAGLLAEVTNGRLKLSSEHLTPVTNKQILIRILANLYGVYARGMDYTRALAAVERMLLIAPNTASHVRDRGMLLAAMNKTSDAVADLEHYLELAFDAKDAEMVRDRIKEVKLSKARLN